MFYSELIETNQGFQASVNLELDLNRKDKIKGYIPTQQSVKVLGELLRSYYYSTESQNRASVLIGPYGRGKSHLLLVLSALTSMDVYSSMDYTVEEAKAMQRELCSKIASVNAEVGALAKAVVDAGVRTLPVIINSNSRDINQAFLIAINNALEISGLQHLLPSTYFDAAIEVIDKWEKDVPEAYEKFAQSLKDEKTNVESVRIGLRQFEEEKYTLFCEIYPSIAAGMKFNPLMNMDVVKLYSALVDALASQTDYCGINVVFDEFSKFLESNLEKSQMYNLKIIQDLAEVASRSGKKQIHFTCITHKDILEYSSSDSFKTVEGRFSKLYFVASSEQNYELISNAIVKRDGYSNFVMEHKETFSEMINIASRANIFKELSEDSFEEKVVYGCFPLAPLTVYSLIKISELVGQNERTLFTFLANRGANTLGEFLDTNHDGVEFVTIDIIYNYFEELFKKEVFNASIHSYWAKADAALRQISDINQMRIIKAIAVINMMKDGMIKAIPSHIKAALLMDDISFNKASSELQRNHILSQRDSSEFVMLTANGVDVQKNISNLIASKALKVNVCNELNERWDWGYVIPHEHNDKKCIMRCFKKVFMDADVFCKYKNAQQILDEYPYDGVLIYIVSNDKRQADICSKLNSLKKYPQIVVCMSKGQFDGEEILKRLLATEQLRKNALQNGDAHYLEEIEFFQEDLQKQIITTIEKLYAPASKNSMFLNSEGGLNVNRQASLNHSISDICDRVYEKTPIVNNEMVNKKRLNAQNLKGRNIVVEWLLNHSEDSVIPCMEGYGPEVSIFKSVFSFSGLDSSQVANENGINEVLKVIRTFVTKCENEKGNFKNLYDILLAKPYGMRKGIIPLFIAYILRLYKENIVLYYSGKEVELSASILSNLNENPAKYELLMETGTLEREAYLDRLEAMFAAYADNKAGSANRVYAVMRSMQNWYRSLPEYSKKYTFFLEAGEKKDIAEFIPPLRADLAKYDVNARDLLFVQWSKRLSESGDMEECASKIEMFRDALMKHIPDYRTEMCRVLVAMFVPGYQGQLPKAVQVWYKKLSDNTKQHIFDSSTNSLLTIARNINSYNEDDLLDSLVDVFESVGIEDWNDFTATDFVQSVEASIKKINEYKEVQADGKQDCKVSISIPGLSVEKNFSTDSISPLAQTALNNIESIFEEYNDSLEPDEKLAILARLIERVIQ